jgi:hypothetical protein
MNKKKKKQAVQWLWVIVVGIALGFAIQFVRAWENPPSGTPPEGNVAAPINTGSAAQTKLGNFTSNGTISAGDQFCLRGICISEWPSGGTTEESCMCDNRWLCGTTYVGSEQLCTWDCYTDPNTGGTTCMTVCSTVHPVYLCAHGVWVLVNYV